MVRLILKTFKLHTMYLNQKGCKEELSKLQRKVVDWVRKNVPTKKTKFEHSHVVEYFSAGKALDALMTSSPWAPEKAKVIISCILLRPQELINNDRRGLS